MNGLDKAASTGLVVCAGVTFGVVAMTGVVAAVVFPTMRDLGPTLPEYASYTGPHWPLAAGVIAEKIFQIGFIVVGVALAGAVLALLTAIARNLGRRFPICRAGLLVVTLGLYLTHMGWLQPRMNAAANEYRQAAREGDKDTAAEAKSQFDALHPTASKLVGATTLAALGLFVCAAWSATGTRPGRRDDAEES